MTNSASQPTPRPPYYWYLPVIVGLLVFAALTWANYLFAENSSGGNDFLVHWVGTRSFIEKGQSPYSEETALEIQMMVYGREVQQGEHHLRVVYPFYSEIIFAPFALVENYTLARALWMSMLEIAILGIGVLSINLTGWRVKSWMVPIYWVFALIWYHGARALVNGNAVVLVALFIVSAFIAIRKDQDSLAGLLLAFATIKPHLVVLLILFVFVWAVSHHRWSLIAWTFGWISILVLIGVLFIPDWLLQNIREILLFPSYNPALSLGSALEIWWPGVGTWLRWGLTVFLIILLAFEWRRGWGKGFHHFLWTACLTLGISQWVGIATDPGNFILLFLPMVFIFSVIKDRQNQLGDWIILGIMVVLFVGLWWLFLSTVEYGYQPLQNPIMFVPMPFLVLVGLYWARRKDIL